VFPAIDPFRVDPVTKSIDEVIVCTFIVCAVKVPLTVRLSADDAVAANDELTAFVTVTSGAATQLAEYGAEFATCKV
jgi:hypothetical protein